jgi:outer membrane protein OmpA-like peptidoglycan-associated protein
MRYRESNTLLSRSTALIALLCLLCIGSHAGSCQAQSATADDAARRPSIDLGFRYTDDLSDEAIGTSPDVAALAKALATQDLKGSTFVIACHVATGGSEATDQDLSIRCAERVRRVLIEKFGVAADTLIAVGYGRSKLKNPADPSAIENQRLEIVNMGTAK